MNWKNLLEFVSESLNDHLQLRTAYLIAENRILRPQIDGRIQLTESERKELAEIGQQLGRKALAEIATVAKPDTILAWHRKFADQQVNTSEPHKPVGRPRVDRDIEDVVIRMARENRSWGYDRIQGSLKHLGYTISDQMVGNILKRHGIPPAPERKKTLTWREFVRIHMDVLRATDFFNGEVWSWFGQVCKVVLYFLVFVSRKRHAVGMILYGAIQRPLQCASNLMIAPWGVVKSDQHRIHDRSDKPYPTSEKMRAICRLKPVVLLPRPPNVSLSPAHGERLHGNESLLQLLQVGEYTLRQASNRYEGSAHVAYPGQVEGHVIQPSPDQCAPCDAYVLRPKRLGSTLRHAARDAA